MELVKMNYQITNEKQNPLKLYKMFQKELKKIGDKIKAKFQINYKKDGKLHNIEVSLPGVEYYTHIDKVFNVINNCIADYLVEDLESDIFKHSLKKVADHLEFDYKEINIKKYFIKQLRLIERKSKIIEALEIYLNDNTNLNLNGFITFRLKEYQHILYDLAEEVSDNYLMDQQYEFFKADIKYIAYLREPKIDLVNVVVDGDTYSFFNNQQESIKINLDDAVINEKTVNDITSDDLILSQLLELSPRKIHIYTNKREKDTVKLICEIFGEDVIVHEKSAYKKG